jgi:hypothetical protein
VGNEKVCVGRVKIRILNLNKIARYPLGMGL